MSILQKKKVVYFFIKKKYQMKQDVSLIRVIKLLLYYNENKNKKIQYIN